MKSIFLWGIINPSIFYSSRTLTTIIAPTFTICVVIILIRTPKASTFCTCHNITIFLIVCPTRFELVTLWLTYHTCFNTSQLTIDFDLFHYNSQCTPQNLHHLNPRKSLWSGPFHYHIIGGCGSPTTKIMWFLLFTSNRAIHPTHLDRFFNYLGISCMASTPFMNLLVSLVYQLLSTWITHSI